MKKNELDLNDLENITGGEYDPDVAYIETYVIRNGYLYSTSNIRETVGQISAGQKVGLHPDFLYTIIKSTLPDSKKICGVYTL